MQSHALPQTSPQSSIIFDNEETLNQDKCAKMREEDPDNYDFADEATNAQTPAIPVLTPKRRFLNNKPPREKSFLPSPRLNNASTFVAESNNTKNVPLYVPPFPPFNPTTLQEAYKQWSFWQWAMFGGTHHNVPALNNGAFRPQVSNYNSSDFNRNRPLPYSQSRQPSSYSTFTECKSAVEDVVPWSQVYSNHQSYKYAQQVNDFSKLNIL